MLAIRLFRTGKKNQPFFKVVVTDKENSVRCGRYVEEVGFVNPLTKEKKLNQERIKYWLSVGAKPSPTVFNLFVSEKIIEGKKIPKQKKSKKPIEQAAAAPAPEVVAPAASQAPSPELAEGPKAEAEKPAAEVPKEAPKTDLSADSASVAEATPAEEAASVKAEEPKPEAPVAEEKK